MPSGKVRGYDVESFTRLPVLEGGRAPEQQGVRDANVDQRQEDERDAPRDGMVRDPPLH